MGPGGQLGERLKSNESIRNKTLPNASIHCFPVIVGGCHPKGKLQQATNTQPAIKTWVSGAIFSEFTLLLFLCVSVYRMPMIDAVQFGPSCSLSSW